MSSSSGELNGVTSEPFPIFFDTLPEPSSSASHQESGAFTSSIEETAERLYFSVPEDALFTDFAQNLPTVTSLPDVEAIFAAYLLVLFLLQFRQILFVILLLCLLYFGSLYLAVHGSESTTWDPGQQGFENVSLHLKVISNSQVPRDLIIKQPGSQVILEESEPESFWSVESQGVTLYTVFPVEAAESFGQDAEPSTLLTIVEECLALKEVVKEGEIKRSHEEGVIQPGQPHPTEEVSDDTDSTFIDEGEQQGRLPTGAAGHLDAQVFLQMSSAKKIFLPATDSLVVWDPGRGCQVVFHQHAVEALVRLQDEEQLIQSAYGLERAYLQLRVPCELHLAEADSMTVWNPGGKCQCSL